MKDLIKFELSVMIEKNKSTNERKLIAEIEKLLSKNSQLREINLVQFKKSREFSKTTINVITMHILTNHCKYS